MPLTVNQSLFVVDLTYTAEFDQIDPLIDAHMDWVQAQYDAGLFLASGPKIPRTGGVIIAQAADKATLQTLLTTDPFHQNTVADYVVTEFRASTIADALT